MKLKKLVSLVLSLAIASSYAVQGAAVSRNGSEAQVDAQWVRNTGVAAGNVDYRNYGVQVGFPAFDGYTGNDYYLYRSNYAKGFSAYLRNDLRYESVSKECTLPAATIGYSGVTDLINGLGREVYYLPTLIGQSDMELIAENLRAPKLSIPITEPINNIEYTASLTRSGAAEIAQSLGKGGEVNLALSFAASRGVLEISLIGARRSMGGSIEYKINFQTFNTLLSAAGISGQPLTLYNGDGSVQKPTVVASTNAEFTLNSDNGFSVYYMAWDETQYLTQKQAQEMIDKEIEKLKNTDIALLKEQIEELKEEIRQLNDKYISEDDIKQMIRDYFSEEVNLKALVEAIFKHESFDDLLEKKLKELLTDVTEIGSFKGILQGYIIGLVTTELKNLETGLYRLESLIISAIEKQIQNIFNQNTTEDKLKDFLLGIQLLDSLKGQDGKDGKDGVDGKDGKDGKDGVDGKDGKDGVDGKDGKDGINGKDGADGNDGAPGRDGLNGLNGRDGLDGIDGEDFAEWATRNYGGIGNFINQISFEGWARANYGSVDNFIRSISGADGLSAYDLAVANGYHGTLGQWLESLQGKDGKSAYDLAVDNGYLGTLDQWLESLQGSDGEDGADGEDGRDGKDGEDGRDGRDGRDGSIVYVNGTYGQLPSSDNADTGTTAAPASSGSVAGNNDVYLTVDETPRTYASKGGVANPSTGAAVGIILPAAAAFSVFLVKKGGRKRGRR